MKNPEAEHEEVKVHSNGEILSETEGIASVSRRNELVQLYPNAIAVEMDGDGKLLTKLSPDYVWLQKPLIIRKPIDL